MANIGGKVSHTSIVKGYTEYKNNGCVYRSHPCYSQIGAWYDWGYFQWTGVDKPIASIMMMIIDLSYC